MGIKYGLSEDQQKKFDEWYDQQSLIAVEHQKENPPDVPQEILDSFWESGYPYGGAIGGDYTLMFTPTSIGVIVEARHAFTQTTIDLTDYEGF